MVRPREPLPTAVSETPALPAEYDSALEAGLSELGLSLGDDVRSAIDAHARLLLAWTSAINLTAIRDPAGVARSHVVDSLAAVPVLHERGIDRFVDLGSGGGYPGIPLAAAVPAARALLIDPVGKKARFLGAAIEAARIGTVAEAAAVRAETLASDPRHRGRWPAVTARAVGSLPELVELAFPLLEPGGLLVAWKRGDLRGELDAATSAAAALGGGSFEIRRVRVTGLETHCLVLATTRGRAPDAYPRDPAVRRRRPWGQAHC
jgi:16S rRNA (guanine527-N7)-methyltransferase